MDGLTLKKTGGIRHDNLERKGGGVCGTRFGI